MNPFWHRDIVFRLMKMTKSDILMIILLLCTFSSCKMICFLLTRVYLCYDCRGNKAL